MAGRHVVFYHIHFGSDIKPVVFVTLIHIVCIDLIQNVCLASVAKFTIIERKKNWQIIF